MLVSCMSRRRRIQHRHRAFAERQIHEELHDAAGNESLLQSLTIAEKIKDYDQLYLLYSNLAIVFSHLNQVDKMLYYTRKVRGIAYLSKDKTQVVKRLSFVADSYNNYYNQKQTAAYKDSVFIISREILELSKRISYDFGLYRSYELMHNKPYYEGDFKKSLLYLDSAANYINHTQSFNSLQSKATIYRKKHEIYMELKDFKSALLCTDSILKFARASEQGYTLLSAFKRKYETYKAMNDSKNALFYFEAFSSLQDSLYGKEKLEIVSELEARYDKVKNEKQIQKLSQEKKILDQEKTIDSLKINLLWVGIIITILAICLIFILFRQKNLKQIQLRHQLELKLNRSRINPHFFFNSLSAFQAVLIKEEDKKKLLLNFGTFSKFMRQILESSYQDFIPLEKEIQILENYIRLQLLRDENKFSYHFNIADDIRPDEVLLPAMVLQPIVENAIEHGFKTYRENGKLELVFRKAGDFLHIEIRDNGVFHTGGKNNPEHRSRSGQITKDRFELLSRLYKKDYTVDLTVDKEGTRVSLKIPLIYESTDR